MNKQNSSETKGHGTEKNNTKNIYDTGNYKDKAIMS
jgi:hypothetical protein